MRRRIGNRLIMLAYRICPPLKAELQHAVEQIACTAAEYAAETAMHETARQLLAHQQRAARAAMLQ